MLGILYTGFFQGELLARDMHLYEKCFMLNFSLPFLITIFICYNEEDRGSAKIYTLKSIWNSYKILNVKVV